MPQYSYLVSGTCNAGTFSLSIDAATEEQARIKFAVKLLASGYHNIKITKAEKSRLVYETN
jgi:hypothetical protein